MSANGPIPTLVLAAILISYTVYDIKFVKVHSRPDEENSFSMTRASCTSFPDVDLILYCKVYPLSNPFIPSSSGDVQETFNSEVLERFNALTFLGGLVGATSNKNRTKAS